MCNCTLHLFRLSAVRVGLLRRRRLDLNCEGFPGCRATLRERLKGAVGQKSFADTLLAIGSKDEVKKEQEQFHKNDCEGEVLKDIDEIALPEKGKSSATTASKKAKKGKKEVSILCITQPPERMSEVIALSPDITPEVPASKTAIAFIGIGTLSNLRGANIL